MGNENCQKNVENLFINFQADKSAAISPAMSAKLVSY